MRSEFVPRVGGKKKKKKKKYSRIERIGKNYNAKVTQYRVNVVINETTGMSNVGQQVSKLALTKVSSSNQNENW